MVAEYFRVELRGEDLERDKKCTEAIGGEAETRQGRATKGRAERHRPLVERLCPILQVPGKPDCAFCQWHHTLNLEPIQAIGIHALILIFYC